MKPQNYTGLIYLIVNVVNNKKYVGQTVQNIKDRFWSHCAKNSQCPKLRNAIQKYGKENFKIITLKVFACSDFETLHKQLDYWETWYIEYYHSVEQGYNCTYGGQNVKHPVTEETRKKMSESLKKFYSEHPEVAQRIANQNRGKRRDPEVVKKWLATKAAKSEEEKLATGRRISQSKMGKPNKKVWKPILQYDLDGNLIKEWPSVAAAKKSLNTKSTHIGNCANGRRKTAYGYVWKWKYKI